MFTWCLFQSLDYDDSSGVYLGPRRNFDDEDLDYLTKDDDEIDENEAEVTSLPPASPLMVDSVSGIYLGFDCTEANAEKEEAAASDTSETADTVSEETKKDEVIKINEHWKASVFSLKTGSKYKIISDNEKPKNVCFRFIRKVWGKTESDNSE